MSENLNVALDLAKKGYHILPLCWPDSRGYCACGLDHSRKKTGKAPSTNQGLTSASTNLYQIHHWWSTQPLANIGIALNSSKLMAVDPDSVSAHNEVLKRGLPETWKRHSRVPAYIFTLPDHLTGGNRFKIGNTKEIDLLINEYIVVFGRHQQGNAIYLDNTLIPIATPPDWVIDECNTASKKKIEWIDAIPFELLTLDISTMNLPTEVFHLLNSISVKDRSFQLWKFNHLMQCLLYDEQVVLSLLMDSRFAISSKPREKGMVWTYNDIRRCRAALKPKIYYDAKVVDAVYDQSISSTLSRSWFKKTQAVDFSVYMAHLLIYNTCKRTTYTLGVRQIQEMLGGGIDLMSISRSQKRLRERHNLLNKVSGSTPSGHATRWSLCSTPNPTQIPYDPPVTDPPETVNCYSHNRNPGVISVTLCCFKWDLWGSLEIGWVARYVWTVLRLGGPQTLDQLVSRFEASESDVMTQLKRLKFFGLVEECECGQWIGNEITVDRAEEIASQLGVAGNVAQLVLKHQKQRLKNEIPSEYVNQF
jgi:hypothetical protein